MTAERVKRTIHFYDLNLEYEDDFDPADGDQFRELFSIIAKLVKSKSPIRYQILGEKAIFFQDVKFEPASKVIIGKIRCVRKDLLPEIMNTTTDEARGIEAEDDEGSVETTHFVIHHSESAQSLALEYNQFGAKFQDFIHYIEHIGSHKNILKAARYRLISNNDLASVQARIRKCSEFVVKVHKDNIAEIQNVDTGLYSALKASIDHFQTDFATIILKFDFRQRQETNEVNKVIKNIIKVFKRNPDKKELFNSLHFKSEDTENNNLLEVFDLLVDKLKCEVSVLKKERYRTVVSEDIFQKMKSELIKAKL